MVRQPGKKTIGTLIPIFSEEQARADKSDYFIALPWHFDEFVKREQAYLSAGGRFIVPLPEFRLIWSTTPRASSIDALLRNQNNGWRDQAGFD